MLTRDYREERKEQFILEHQDKWRKIGNEFKESRESYGLTKQFVAKELGVSVSKVSNFENGNSITHAKLMENAYFMLFILYKLSQLGKQHNLKTQN